MMSIKSKREIEIMRKAAAKLHDLFFDLKKMVRPGVKTIQIDEAVENIIRSQGAEPAFKGYRGYPAATCISINEEVVHGIPSERRLDEGDIVSIDVGLVWKEFYSDAARTWPV
jgi:methionyl aminopeptidase